MKLFYTPAYSKGTPDFPTTRKAAWVAESLLMDPIAGVDILAPMSATDLDLQHAHDPTYVAGIRGGLPGTVGGLHWTPGLYAAVAASTGGVVEATLQALRSRRHAGSLSSGLHHARRSHGAGFCTFNGLAVAACLAHEASDAHVLILDLDAHCGGGTDAITRSWDFVTHLDLSTSAFDAYQSTSLQVVSDPSAYLPALRAALSMAPTPDVVLYNAGMDPFLGDCGSLTVEHLRTREAIVRDWADDRGVPVAFVLAGGYSEPETLVALHRLTLEAFVESE